jgi:hypothetical protein
MRTLPILALSTTLAAFTAGAHPVQDPFTINIATSEEVRNDGRNLAAEDKETPTSGADAEKGSEEAGAEENLQLDIIVEEEPSCGTTDVNPERAEGAKEEQAQTTGETSGGDGKTDPLTDDSDAEGETAADTADGSAGEEETESLQLDIVVEEESPSGGTDGNYPADEGTEEDQVLPAGGTSGGKGETDLSSDGDSAEAGSEEGSEGEWTTVEIPQISGSIKVPAGWHRPTAEQALKSLEFVDFPSYDDKAVAEMGALAIGRMSLLITKYPEPMEGLNPGVSITWEPMPLVFEQVPLEARSEGLARVLSTVVVPEIKANDPGFQLLEGPKAVNDEGGGAWITFKGTTPLKSGGSNESIVRLYILTARDHILTVQIEAPADRESGEEVLPELWAIFESLSYAK